tara:strand:+ start:3197 stop:4735 length:1539 start_codon:yes stop_codon:yes gene_type:complete
MAIKRFFCNADNTITNAFKSNLITRGTGSNMGASDVLEVFSILGQASTSSVEKSRALLNFSVSDILTSRNNEEIPVSGNVKFFLRVFNAPHNQTLPKSFDLAVLPISRSWNEGPGLDMETYSDEFASNWAKATQKISWTTQGGDFHEVGYTAGKNLPHYKQTFTNGTENLNVNITSLVEEWIEAESTVDTDRENYGVLLKMSGSFEDGSKNRSYYTKKFFSRSTEFFYKRPMIEARWDDSIGDDRNSFFLSSSLMSGEDNLNTLYLYNIVRGKLKNIPILGANSGSNSAHRIIHLQVFPSGNIKNQVIKPKTLPIGGGVTVDNATVISGGWVSTGIYSASFAFTGSEKEIFDVWSKPTGVSQGIQLTTGSVFTVKTHNASDFNPNRSYVTTITNLKTNYDQSDKVRFRLFVREKNWQPNIYTVASNAVESYTIENGYYRVYRVIDGLDVISFGTGSGQQTNYTKLSYDKNGNYFDLDMMNFESDYSYAIQFMFETDGKTIVQDKVHKFRVGK